MEAWDVGGWLQGLGLGQYEVTFRENEIDGDVLLELSEFDLANLGLPLGPRKRLLKAIAKLDRRQGFRRPLHYRLHKPRFRRLRKWLESGSTKRLCSASSWIWLAPTLGSMLRSGAT